jgi:hypothetical protein
MFKAERLSRTATITLDGPFEQVFPLFGPIREKEWAEGWDPQIVLLETDNIEKHMVFQTHPHLDDEQGMFTWTVSAYNPAEGFIEYTVFAETRLWWISIKCRQRSDKASCEAEIAYTYVGLNQNGNELNRLALAAMYKHDLKDWEHAINHYLDTGSLLRHH